MATHYSVAFCCHIVATFEYASLRSCAASYAVLRETKISRREKFGFQDRCIKPLCHPSGSSNANNATAVGIGKSYSKIGKTRTKSIGALNLPSGRLRSEDSGMKARILAPAKRG